MSGALIAERGRTHGEFADTARIARRLKAVIEDEIARRAARGQPPLSDEQREALDQGQVKTARIIAGDPDHPDHWRDLSGYALLGIDPKRALATPPDPRVKPGDGFWYLATPYSKYPGGIAEIAALRHALGVLLDEATGFNVGGVYFDEPCMGHKGPELARKVLYGY